MKIPPKQPLTDYVTVPEGIYRVRIAEVRERETRRGDTLWALHLVVAEGDYADRVAAWDNLMLSERGAVRRRLVFDALGIDDEVHPNDLVGLEAMVTIRAAEYEGVTGQVIRRNEVPYAGWEALACSAKGQPPVHRDERKPPGELTNDRTASGGPA